MRVKWLAIFALTVGISACSESEKAVCVPSCEGRECGLDGCGGTCGACDILGTRCEAGRCEFVGCDCDLATCDAGCAVCMPTCGGRECGSDGCGGTCGACDDGVCSEATGQCLSYVVRGQLSIEKPTVIFNAYQLPKFDGVTEVPAAGVPLSLRNVGGVEIASTTVQSDGSFEMTLHRLPQSSDWISIVPAWRVNDKLKVAVLRTDSEGYRYWNWHLSLSHYQTPDDPGNLGHIRITQEQDSGAIFLYQTLVDAYQWLFKNQIFMHLGTLPSMAVIWTPGKRWSCGTCVSENPTRVGSQTLDTTMFIGGEDESESSWGYPTVLHEFGHYVLERRRDDNMGGAHTMTSASTPTLAWSEGWATFYALMMMSLEAQSPVSQYWRILGNGSYWIDYAKLDQQAGFGSIWVPRPTPTPGMKQDLSEAWVTYMLWDFFDGLDVDDPDPDPIALGSAKMISAISSDRYRYLERFDEGRSVSGTDFVDYLEALVCDLNRRGDETTAQSLMDFVEHRDFPYDRAPECP